MEVFKEVVVSDDIMGCVYESFFVVCEDGVEWLWIFEEGFWFVWCFFYNF